MQKILSRLSLVSLVCIFLVIVAGSVVRMTGSGMGCPDWPKCFGYYIPPTSPEALAWSADRSFDKGNIIIKDERLLVAKQDFTSDTAFNSENWEVYTKHDYAIFNAAHTWTEYINRLFGALSGLPVLAFFIVSFFYIRKDPLIMVLGLTGVLLLGFEAWLGKVVVDGNLVPHQITYHMFGAIALVGLYIYLYIRLNKKSFGLKKIDRDKRVIRLGWLALIIVLLQTFLGTIVREEVDFIGKEELLADTNWIDQLSVYFLIHRSFSIAVVLIIGWYAIKVFRTGGIAKLPRLLMITIIIEVLLGMGLAYFDMPAFMQPLHLLLAIVGFGLIVAIMLIYSAKTSSSI